MGTPNNNRFQTYPWSATSGYGTKFSQPSNFATTSTVYKCAFNHDGTAIAVSHRTSPFISVYAWSSSSGFGTRYANPSVLPASWGQNGINFSPDGTALVVNVRNVGLTVYRWSSAGFGTQYSNLSPNPSTNMRDATFSPGSEAIIIPHDASPYVSAYKWDSTNGFGTKYADPSTTMTGTLGIDVAFND